MTSVTEEFSIYLTFINIHLNSRVGLVATISATENSLIKTTNSLLAANPLFTSLFSSSLMFQ